METNNTRTYEVKDVLGFISRDLGNISIPANILGILQPDQIMAIKHMVIDPIEAARQSLQMCIDAINRTEAEQAMAAQEENVIDLGEIGTCEEPTEGDGGKIVPLPTGE